MSPPDFETLLGIGVSLVMAGIILRGFAASARRDLARRRQHLLDDRKPEATGRGGQMELAPSWLEKHLGQIAIVLLVLGTISSVLAFFRR